MSTMPQPLGQYQSTNDPRKLAQNQRAMVQQTGTDLMNQANAQQQQGESQSGQIFNYLNPIEQNLAAGKGGYNANELSQIWMTPEQQQQMVTSAGISARAPMEAAVGAAERAAAASGGNPAALAAFRARAAQQAGGQAADAMTQARVAASNAAAARAENVGQTRIGQQEQALNNQQQQAQMYNQNAQNAANRALQAYGTQTQGTNQAAQLGLAASQTPSSFDKIMGGLSGAAGGILSHIAEGDPNVGQGQPAIVGEEGPEKVVRLADGDMSGMDVTPPGGFSMQGGGTPSYNPVNDPQAWTQPQPNWWQRRVQDIKNQAAQQQQQQPQQQQQQQPMQQQWNPTTPYTQMGNAVGQGLGMLFNKKAEGDVIGGPQAPDVKVTDQSFGRPGGYPSTFQPRPPGTRGYDDYGPPGIRMSEERYTKLPSGAQIMQRRQIPGRYQPFRSPRMADGGTIPDTWGGRRGPGTGMLPPMTNPGSMLAPGPPQGANGIFTRPTQVLLNRGEAVVPLNFRPNARARPSMAALPAARQAPQPGGFRARR